MAADSVSIISSYDLSQSEEIKSSNEEDGIYKLPRENLETITDQKEPEIMNESWSTKGECKDKEKYFERENVVFKKKNPDKKVYSIIKDMVNIMVVSMGIIAASVVCTIPWATIPRTNSIIYQS